MDQTPSLLQQHKRNLQRVGAVLLAILVWQLAAMGVVVKDAKNSAVCSRG